MGKKPFIFGDEMCGDEVFRGRSVPGTKCSGDEVCRGRSAPGTKCSGDEMLPGTKCARGRNVPGDEVFRGRNVPGDEVFPGTKCTWGRNGCEPSLQQSAADEPFVVNLKGHCMYM